MHHLAQSRGIGLWHIVTKEAFFYLKNIMGMKTGRKPRCV
nr:MAG TPA_asm: hypothetical protein [Caudoviricetes sp.]